ncbi:alpha/beta fold hydrolase [Leucobacter coleopterorum]|uniref:Alpha/beta fold hydrolase n=1 Tax=Leucobacter coleopterorum TaxID=2714933 RepID=A0ABX6JXF8_9MICO|nr:alpha/beta fold hydrolase [Leucobacter coleopterorum]QIM18933.1 alpha/beta fold hydrolase [Leucobacter coleopterorum]
MSLSFRHFPANKQDRPPVILLHGFASNSNEDYLSTGWAESLNEGGRSAITIDLPAHGSNPPLTSASEASTTATVTAILDTIDTAISLEHKSTGFSATGFDVIGYSLGARLAWELPLVSPHVRRLVLGGLSPTDPFSAVDPTELRGALTGTTPQSPLVGMMANLISAPEKDTASLALLIQGLATEPFTPQLESPTVPTLFVTGSRDALTQGIDDLAARLPHASITRVPGDHREALDSPEFRSTAIEFLSAQHH